MAFDFASILKKEELLKNKVLLIAIAVGIISLWYGYNKIYKGGMAAIQQIKNTSSQEVLKTDVSRRLETLQAGFENYKRYFRKDADITWLIDKVSRAAKESGLEIISLTPQPAASLNKFIYSDVDVSVRGTFHQLGDFVSGIEGSGEFVRVEKLSFKKGDKDSLDADIVVSTYSWKG